MLHLLLFTTRSRFGSCCCRCRSISTSLGFCLLPLIKLNLFLGALVLLPLHNACSRFQCRSKLACFMLPNWTDWYPWSVTFAWWQYRLWIITWKKGQRAMITNSKNSVKAFLDPGIHLNVTLAQELICLGEWLSTLSHSKSTALH